ncbi:retropepsin-like aspartic protease family protein [Chromatium okenii]|uniref:Peptidase A2A n=1 Tax=Chromatium okenii TaxID=61644 RepID=A0A2S7XQX4_9GAMM|nr:retropepsin-like aspartic protease [Chromatium okenii]MBV5310535.1 clan AA aspartic protease [Chromatium okenii]PQJ95801.1 peptidase A2A [Chromatium okenii]
MKSKYYWVIAALLFTYHLSNAAAPSTMVAVTTELERLMSIHGFEVTGIEQTADATAHVEGDELLSRLHILLENFNYVLVQTPDRKVERILILGEKTASAPPPAVTQNSNHSQPNTSSSATEIILPTQRQGTSHLVTVTLEGVNHQKIRQSLLIDTGADHVVLPTSLITKLGLNPNTLRQRPVQTANGVVNAQAANLSGLWLDSQRLADVPVAFIDDQRLGGQALLGMAVLGQFQMTIDDTNNQIKLLTP